MTGKRESVVRCLEAARIDRLLRPWLGGRGVLFALHRVAPSGSTVMDPDMTVTTEFLAAALDAVEQARCECITLDEVPSRLSAPRAGRPFVSLAH